MKGKLHLYYDAEGDFLEIHVGKFTDGHFKNVGKGIFERIDKKTGKVTGVAVMSFKKRTDGPKDIELTFPVKIELTSA